MHQRTDSHNRNQSRLTKLVTKVERRFCEPNLSHGVHFVGHFEGLLLVGDGHTEARKVGRTKVRQERPEVLHQVGNIDGIHARKLKGRVMEKGAFAVGDRVANHSKNLA
jgi:hypothetical protein